MPPPEPRSSTVSPSWRSATAVGLPQPRLAVVAAPGSAAALLGVVERLAEEPVLARRRAARAAAAAAAVTGRDGARRLGVALPDVLANLSPSLCAMTHPPIDRYRCQCIPFISINVNIRSGSSPSARAGSPSGSTSCDQPRRFQSGTGVSRVLVRDEAGALHELQPVHVAGAVRQHVGGAHPHDELGLGVRLEQRVVARRSTRSPLTRSRFGLAKSMNRSPTCGFRSRFPRDRYMPLPS